MDLEKALLRINQLENEVLALKKTISSQSTKTNNLDEKISSFLENVRDQKKEVDRLGVSINKMGHVDATIAQLRKDINRRIDEAESRLVDESKMRVNLQQDEIKAVNQSVVKIKKEIIAEVNQKLKDQSEDSARVLQKAKEIEANVMAKIQSDDEVKSSINMLKQELGQFKKKLDSTTVEISTFKKRQDEIRQKQDDILNNIRTYDSRMTEIVATEVDRTQSYNKFIEQQTLVQRDRDRVWKEWQQQIAETTQQVYRLIPELQKQQLEMDKSKSSFEEVTQRIERRINEVTELYRLMDDKFRQEWETYKSDSDKKWANISIIQEEKQEGLTTQLDKIKERMLVVEDSTHEMQDVLVLMSKEIQKGMQSLMNMVNGWMDAFGEVKSSNNVNRK
jgi:hypothetical protein